MKKILLIALTIAGMLTACKTQRSATYNMDKETAIKEMPKDRLELVSYNYQGMAYEPFYDFCLMRSNGQSTFQFMYQGQSMQYAVGDSLFDQARAIIEEEQMYKYKTYYDFDSESRILDGYKWSFSAVFEGNQRISSGGSNSSPEDNGLNRISKLFYQAARTLLDKEMKGEHPL